MTEQTLLPRFRKPPVSEVAIGAQFQAPMLTPVHLGLYYSRVKARFPTVTVQPPLAPVFEMFGATPAVSFPFPQPPLPCKPALSCRRVGHRCTNPTANMVHFTGRFHLSFSCRAVGFFSTGALASNKIPIPTSIPSRQSSWRH